MFKKRKYLIGLITLMATVALCSQITLGQEKKSGWDYLQNGSSNGGVNQGSAINKNVSQSIYKTGDIESGVMSIKQPFDGFPADKTISLKLRDASAIEVLRELAREGGKNIIIDSSVSSSKTINCDLEDVSINQAMELVLSAAELESRIVDGTIFIASKTGMQNKGLNRRVVKSFQLSYANAVDVASVLNASIFNSGLEVTSSVKEQTAKAKGTSFQATVTSQDLQTMPSVASQGDYTEATDDATTGSGAAAPAPGIESTSAASGTVKTASVRKVRVIEENVDEPKNATDANKNAGEIKIKGVKFSSTDFDIPNNNGGPIVIPDTRTNTILVAGIEDDIYLAERTIQHLDRALKQISIEVSLVEITRVDAEDLGLTVASGAKGFTGGFNNPLDATGNFNTAPVFNPNHWVDNGFIPSPLPTSAFGGPQTIGIATQAGEAALQLSTIKNITSNIAVRLNALMTKRKAKLIANPNVVALDGAESLVKLTQQVINKVETTTTATGIVNTTIVLTDAGIVLHVRPKISKDGYISLSVRPSVTAPAGAPQTIGPVQIQLISTREVLLENVRVKSGETIALAGLIRENAVSEETKIPLVGDIPFIGSFFRTINGTKDKTELVILLTPKIIDDIATQTYPIVTPSTSPIN